MEKRYYLVADNGLGTGRIYSSDSTVVPFDWFVRNESVLSAGFEKNTFSTEKEANSAAVKWHFSNLFTLGAVVVNNELFFAETGTPYENFFSARVMGKYLVYLYDKDQNVWQLACIRNTKMHAIMSAFNLNTVIQTKEGIEAFGSAYDWIEIYYLSTGKTIVEEKLIGYIDASSKLPKFVHPCIDIKVNKKYYAESDGENS